jgi:EmrB/QacA subfamily drug resistance transporter
MSNTPYRHRWIAFGAVISASAMELMDATIVQVAAPAIRDDIGGSYAVLQWMTAAYTLTLAVLLLIGGRLGDLFGRKRMLVGGIGGFTLASAAAALAQSPEMLIGSRVLQAVFGAMMTPQVFGLIRDLFPPAEMGKAWGVFGPVMGLSAVIGPIVGGTLVDADLFGSGWRAIFAVNVPIGIAAAVIAARYIPAAPAAARTTRLDLTGVALAGIGTLMLVYPLVQGRELGWPTWVTLVLAGSLPVLALFAVYQVRRKRSGATPLVEPSVFAKRSYVSGIAFSVFFFGAMGGVMLTTGLLLQLGLGYSPIHAALTMAPWALGAIFGSAFGGMSMHKLGRTVLQIGLALMAAGLAAQVVALQIAGTGIDHWDLLAPNLIGGAGMGMIFVPLFDIILGGVEEHELGSASGVLGSIEQLGMALGIAVLGTIFFGIVGAEHAAAVFVDAAQTTSLVTIGLIALAFVTGFSLPRRPRADEAPAAAEPATAPLIGPEPAFA